ncbi:MAG: bifunctional 4-hydroxy-2-oxoglutarate aldolase/2-dehydro-3-deoxy-phosphogluconate aldolase [Ruminococcus sp.]|jgi:Entner-Doudoroff aldolase|nr:bifunctional 4-hydroxy-2-oxoglutarate aldolase/2-dehydro-3-deoxy-phosphogluconate aldolase [Ruminococcus sp.]
MDKSFFGALYVNGIVPVAVIDDENDAVPLAGALLAGGIDCIEVTFRTGAAAKSIELIHKNFPDMLIGAGTILTPSQAESAMAAGAGFIVSPGFSKAVTKFCKASQMPFIPGVATATEIITALENDIKAVKFFPAKQAGGLEYLKALSPVFTDVKFMPTGGIDLENLADYLELQSVFCCGGSFMCSKKLLEEKDYKKIAELSKSAVEIVKNKREKRYFYA